MIPLRQAACVLDSCPESVGLGRHFVSDTLAGWGVTTEPRRLPIDEVLLVVSELLANAVRVSALPVVLSIEVRADHLHASVRDASPCRAVAGSASNSAAHGRGLAIVDALADRWGQSDYDGTAKNVWADVLLVGSRAGR